MRTRVAMSGESVHATGGRQGQSNTVVQVMGELPIHRPTPDDVANDAVRSDGVQRERYALSSS